MVTLDKLDKLSFCRGLSEEHSRLLGSVGEFRTYQTGESIFQEGVSCAEVYLLIEGKVALEESLPARDPMCVQTLGAGELLGYSPILGFNYMMATARVLAPTRVLALNAARILAMAELNPAFGLDFLRRTATALAVRLNATRLRLLEVCCEAPQEVS
jgi:CRP-like cAMP-binding protein